jgi:hypothetical protein
MMQQQATWLGNVAPLPLNILVNAIPSKHFSRGILSPMITTQHMRHMMAHISIVILQKKHDIRE